MNRLLLLDGNALMHRAYHALPPLTSPTGKPTGAIYGFVSMLLRLQTDLHPYGYAVAFDRPAPTFRKKLLATYQSQRPEMESALSLQMETIHDVLEAFHVPVFEKDGYEADDVIGTIVKKLSAVSSQWLEKTNKEETDHRPPTTDSHIDQVIIATGDRDILQLVVDEKVLLYMPVKGLSEAKLYGEKEVIERLGVAPKAIPDWKSFAGDSSDNYPGVPGIGPKTACTLVNTYGTTEKVYEALEKGTLDVSEGIKEKLRAGKESAFLSKDLATIRTDAPIEIDWNAMHIPTFDTDEAKAILDAQGFHSLQRRLSPGGLEEKETKKQRDKETKKKKDDDSQMGLF